MRRFERRSSLARGAAVRVPLGAATARRLLIACAALGVVAAACVFGGLVCAREPAQERARRSSPPQPSPSPLAVPLAPQRPGDNPSIMIERANNFIVQGRCEEAVPILERIVAEYPQIAVANDMLARCYLTTSRPRDAAALLERCLESDPRNVSYLQNLGRAYLDEGEREKAVAAWRRLLGGDEKTGSMYGVVAKMEQEAGLYDDAIATLREGTRFKENGDYYEHEVIRLERVVGRDDDAFRDALRIVGRRQGALESELRIVTDIFKESPRRERLVSIADSSAVAAGDRAGPLRALKAMLLIETGRYGDARKSLFGKGAVPPREEDVYSLLVYMGRMGDRGNDPAFTSLNTDLMGYFTERFGPSPRTPAVMLMIASAKREAAHDAGPARERLLREALSLADAARRHKLGAPYLERACILRAQVLFEDLHRPDEALVELAPLGPRYPAQRAEAEELRARILLAMGDRDRAATGLGAIAADPDTSISPIGRYALGRLAFLSGRDGEAVKQLSDLAEERPSSPWANDALELAMDVKGGVQEGGGALALYRAAVAAESRGSYRAAIDSLAEIERRFPGSVLAPRALFMRAGIEADGPGADGGAPDTAAARADYSKLAETYPLHDLAPRALEEIAALEERVSAPAAIARYARIMERYPDYPFMERVRERYIALGKSPGAETPTTPGPGAPTTPAPGAPKKGSK
jgi:tetratricopeptide (TPR) repeat protein